MRADLYAFNSLWYPSACSSAGRIFASPNSSDGFQDASATCTAEALDRFPYLDD